MFTLNKFKILKEKKQQLVSLKEAKESLRISYDYDDSLIFNLVDFAIDAAENFTSKSIKTREIEYTSNLQNKTSFPLKYAPILEVCTLTLKTDKGEMEVKNYHLDAETGLLSLRTPLAGAVLTMRYIAGYSQDSLPLSIRQAILLHVAQMYDSSEQTDLISDEIRNLYGLHRIPKI